MGTWCTDSKLDGQLFARETESTDYVYAIYISGHKHKLLPFFTFHLDCKRLFLLCLEVRLNRPAGITCQLGHMTRKSCDLTDGPFCHMTFMVRLFEQQAGRLINCHGLVIQEGIDGKYEK